MPARKRERDEPQPPVVASRGRGRRAAAEPAGPPPPRMEDIRSTLQRTIERLSIGGNNVNPDESLVGREAHVKQISQFLCSDAYRTLMLFGMPGTGKTCAVKHAIARAGDSITTLFLNGYLVQRPIDVYRSLCQHLTRTRLGHEEVMAPEQAATYLEKRFRTQGWSARTSGRGGGGVAAVPRTCIIIVDELDKCIEKNPKVLYRLVEWLSFPHAYCRLIGIANSMEFPMDPKTKSRLDSTSQVVFQPYNAQELTLILQQRIQASSADYKYPAMTDRAVEVVCKQTASQYGDVRRLLQSTSSAVHALLCSIEEGEVPLPDAASAAKGLVDIRHVHAITSRVFQDRFRDFVMSIKSTILFLVVCTVAVETQRFEDQKGGGLLADDAAGGSPIMGLDYLYQQCLSVLEAYHSRLGFPDASAFTRTVYLSHMATLHEVGFVELSMGGNTAGDSTVDRIPIQSVWMWRTAQEPMWVTMTQLPYMILTMCEVHDFGPQMRPYLTGAK